MDRDDSSRENPLRAFEQRIGGELVVGQLGLVLAAAGVGKTAFLVQIGLDALLREQKILHVSLDQSIERVQSWYDELFADLAEHTQLEEAASARVMIERQRMIQTYADRRFDAGKLQSVMDVLAQHAGFRPALILIDGLDLERGDGRLLGGLRALAQRVGAVVWVNACTEGNAAEVEPTRLPAGAIEQRAVIDVAVFLKPHASHVDLLLLKVHGSLDPVDSTLRLDPHTMRLEDPRQDRELPPLPLDRAEYRLFSGGAPGTERAFGEVAARYGITEVNYSFPGHNPARDQGIVTLSERELRQGDVSLAYVSKRMNRTYTLSPTFRRVLQSIWHQVHSSQQVLVVGVIQDDGTVKGGTGWGAELARVWGKPLWVYDQEQRGWYAWDSGEEQWTPSTTPHLSAATVCGTGTRFLSEDGRAAIEAVFEKTFSSPI